MDSVAGLEDVAARKKAGDIWAIFAGSLGPSYDIQTMLMAARELERRGSRVYIIMAGDGPLRQTITDFVASEPRSNIVFLGQLPPDRLAALYNLCDIGLCAYSSRSNVQMPDKIYDYTAAGLVVVNSLKGEVSEVVEENGIGVQYEAEDAQSLANALTGLASHEYIRKKMRERSYALGDQFDQALQYRKAVDVIHLSMGISTNS